MYGHTRNDKIRNEVIWEKVGVASMADKMKKARLRWFGHVKRRCANPLVRRCERLGVGDTWRGRGRLKRKKPQVPSEQEQQYPEDEDEVLSFVSFLV
ncbi:hypothetical protein MTR67_011539 [Solanum verrucosum]|uniref:Uncharacterized protein n=1 Tax=Solanum verrucosum TaxID=315347 RepID=A0AAF0QDY3_SOLVR|nr:hypothetical protein MTR67_011539 [Solanum verrucosum]